MTFNIFVQDIYLPVHVFVGKIFVDFRVNCSINSFDAFFFGKLKLDSFAFEQILKWVSFPLFVRTHIRRLHSGLEYFVSCIIDSRVGQFCNAVGRYVSTWKTHQALIIYIFIAILCSEMSSPTTPFPINTTHL